MKYVKLGELCEHKIEKLSRREDGKIDYIDIASVDNKEKRIIACQTIDIENAPSRAQQLLKRNDILVSTVRPNLNAVAVCDIESDNILVGSSGYCVLRCNKNVDYRYIFNFCKSNYFVEGLVKVATGASYPAVSNKDVRESLVPLFEIDTQKKIANALDKAQGVIDKRKEQIAACDELIKSQFVEIFGDRYTNTKNWDTKLLEECVQFHNGKAHEKVIDENGKYILVTSKCIATDMIHVRRTNEMLYPLHKDDIVMVMSDVPNGRALAKCLLIQANNLYTLNQRICCFNNYHFEPIFLKELLNRHEYFLSFNDGNGQTNLRKDDILKCRLIFPPIELQNQFAQFVQQVDKLKFEMQQSLVELENNFNSLMQRAFKGELF